MMERGLHIDDEGLNTLRRRDELPVSPAMHAQVLKWMRQSRLSRKGRIQSYLGSTQFVF